MQYSLNKTFLSPPFSGFRAAFFILLGLAYITFNPLTAKAETNELLETITIDQVESGSLLIESNHANQYHPSPTVETEVEIEINGMIAKVNVTQHFNNPSTQWVNGIYVFPLPENAAVDHMKLSIGERIIEGKIKERIEAKKTFQKAKQEGKKASLIEQERPNIFTTSVANIGPNEIVSVSIQYQQIILYDQGVFSIRFPLVVGVRYIPGKEKIHDFKGSGWADNTSEVADASRITPPITASGVGHNNPVSIRLNLNAGFPLINIESSYHNITKHRLNPGHYQVDLTNSTSAANRDFELTWRPKVSHIPQAALFTQDINQDRYALLMLIPPEIDWTRQNTLPKEIIYVIDTSGSMAGGSMPQAKQALLLGLSQLKSEDWFNIIQFNSITESFSEHAIPARENNIERAKKYVHSLQANGGTEMALALNSALARATKSERVRQVVFLTDGSVGNEKQLFEIIDKKISNNRLFTVGIGSAPNSYFMSEAASIGRGTFTYIGKIDEVQEKMLQLFHKLNHPVLRDIEIMWDDKSTVDYWPNPIHDLYIGEPLLISLKLPKNQKQLQLRGKTFQSDWSTNLQIEKGGKATGLNVLWARNKILSLNQKLNRGANAEEIKQEITAIGLKHQIVTRHTSLVAVDVEQTKNNNVQSIDKAVPIKMPYAWEMKIPGQLPQGASSLHLNIILGIVLLILGIVLRNYAYK